MAFPPQAGQQPQAPQGLPPQGMQPQQPPQAPMPAQGMGAAMPQLDGEEVQMLLFSRIQELDPTEMQTLADSFNINPETIAVLFKVLPELGILFDSIMQGSGEGGMPDEQQEQYPADEESQNPLVNDNLSRGLMG